jgi:hypothetical protein
MGEKKHRSQSRQAIIAGEPRCIYCPGPAESVEHMPPRAMFRDSQRPGAMEYGVCFACNSGTRGSDAVATFIALLHPNNLEGSWQAEKVRKLISMIRAHASGVLEELSLHDKRRDEWARRPDSRLLQRFVRIEADGPRIHAYLSVFGAKLAMALYREHVGVALPLGAAVWSQFALNGGMTPKILNDRVKLLPVRETLRQGRKNVGDQFAYRYNCDARTTLAAVVQFHLGLWFTIFASSDQRIIELFYKPEFTQLPASVTVTPGNLLSLLPARALAVA